MQNPRLQREEKLLSRQTRNINFPLDTAPAAVVLDPDQWVLMDKEMVGR
jgi:hypothetical protein